MIIYLLRLNFNGIAKYLRVVSFSFLLFVLFYGVVGQSIQAQDPFVVVLDAGHGGKDPGNSGFRNKYQEKKIVLNITLEIGEKLESQPGIKVIYTRKRDVFVDLIERAEIANKVDADLFVSVHCDAHTSQAYGAGTFVLGLHANQRNFEVAKRENSVIYYEEDFERKYDGFDPNNPESAIGLTLMQEAYMNQSIVAADKIQKRFVKNLKRKDRTVKQAGFIVLKYSYMPSVLVETGFLTNNKEGAYLNSTKGQAEMAATIADAIIDYKNTVQKSVAKESHQSVQSPQSPQVTPVAQTEFRVQIAASKNALDPKPYNFKGLFPIYRERAGGMYRYYYGKTTDYNKAKKWLRGAKRKGYKTAFLVAFSGGKKIPLASALKKK
jgi:N-acetylmuramoyl-L-alanine amidase